MKSEVLVLPIFDTFQLEPVWYGRVNPCFFSPHFFLIDFSNSHEILLFKDYVIAFRWHTKKAKSGLVLFWPLFLTLFKFEPIRAWEYYL
jgi:hypothetical protein